MTIKRLLGAVLTLSITAMLAGCGSTTISQVRDGQTEQPVWLPVEKANPIIKSTMTPDLAALRKIAPGTAKLEVYRLIGHPMYREGMVGVHEWDYVFKLPMPNGEIVTCQYKILFNNNMLSEQTFWNPQLCADIVGGIEAAPPKQEPHTAAAVELSSDFLFDFDSAELSQDAPAAIDAQVVKVLDEAEQVEMLRVIGYTDRLGSDDYNMRLSQERAEAVKNYLVSRGIPAEAITSGGRGESDPVVQCDDIQRNALIKCLKPNRRVRIEVIAR
ncbi:OmpA family protein [Pseudoxanthomonas indica]|uniref:Beta-barrel assembly machine subunit BamE n=1 Tax=Pseudoxanthomonas indica TaxID=428993 RepID=A0A1T5LZS6_9GAMM|nr:OmpA family protein [Pseudoxanthomonas indica]GGD59699.1 membrane protein [Pseudoxanthomonas indica]SKC81472.1 Beta-barrel assembly machine subunit BamE [Pseudoxanthomonas indica]